MFQHEFLLITVRFVAGCDLLGRKHVELVYLYWETLVVSVNFAVGACFRQLRIYDDCNWTIRHDK